MLKTTIIPVASGKGGVGKTFLTANLAIALAEMGHSTIAIDMDLGGSNLSSFLGLPNRFPGTGDFLKARTAELEELLVPTSTPNLTFIPGEGRTPFLANIPYAQKVRLISRIKTLTADYILLDLGAGTAFNTLDFFRIAPYGLIITTPEYPAVMNMLAFIKNFFLRTIVRSFVKNQPVLDLLRSTFKQPMTTQQLTLEVLQSKISAIDSKAGEVLASLCKNYRPRVIFNMGEEPDEMKIAGQINKSLKKILSLEVDYFGFIFNDPTVRLSVKKQTSFLPDNRKSIAALSIVRIVERIVKFWENPIHKSARRIMESSQRFYDDWAREN